VPYTWPTPRTSDVRLSGLEFLLGLAFALAHDHADHTGAEGLASSLPGQSYSFDGSAQPRELFSEGSASEGLEVAFLDIGRRQEVQTEQLKLLDKSGIKISEIKLEVETATVPLELTPND
jgi:hypothetical protein